jgi:hypothetical protein
MDFLEERSRVGFDLCQLLRLGLSLRPLHPQPLHALVERPASRRTTTLCSQRCPPACARLRAFPERRGGESEARGAAGYTSASAMAGG